MSIALLAVVVFLAALLQTLTGFGFALIVMPLATWLFGVQAAAPLVALVACVLYAINLVRYRRAIDRGEVLRLAGAAALGVPVGIWALGSLDEGLVTTGLGVILMAYAGYSVLAPTMPALASRSWAFPAGFLAGCLGGAFNTPGPPVILYGDLRQWPRDGFRSVLQALFLANGLLVILGHGLAGNYAIPTLRQAALVMPALLAGVGAGAWLDRRLDGGRLQRLVTGMIALLGLSLIVW